MQLVELLVAGQRQKEEQLAWAVVGARLEERTLLRVAAWLREVGLSAPRAAEPSCFASFAVSAGVVAASERAGREEWAPERLVAAEDCSWSTLDLGLGGRPAPALLLAFYLGLLGTKGICF